VTAARIQVESTVMRLIFFNLSFNLFTYPRKFGQA
jgi:hypothetical protein